MPTPDDRDQLLAGELAAELARDTETPLPPALAARLVADGERQLAAQREAAAAARAAAAPAPAPAAVLPISSARGAWRARAGWLAAAAAAAAWLLVPSPLARPGAPPPAAVPSVAALRDSLLAAPGVVRVDWGESADPAARGAVGDVVWDPATQRGVMRFVGLAPNDPRLAQYQLWIVDAERDARYPVDGGVFDVAGEGEILIPIRARLPVSRPTLFAVTLEKPGGVVVSGRERLVLAAAG